MSKGGSNRFLTTVEVAELLAVPVRTVRENKDRWRLPYRKVGRGLRFRERDIENWIERQAA